jgi:hypothetical protein
MRLIIDWRACSLYLHEHVLGPHNAAQCIPARGWAFRHQEDACEVSDPKDFKRIKFNYYVQSDLRQGEKESSCGARLFF